MEVYNIPQQALSIKGYAQQAFEVAHGCMESYIQTVDAYYLKLYYETMDIAEEYKRMYLRAIECWG